MALAIMAGETLALPTDQIHVSTPGTGLTPFDQVTGSSRSTHSMGSAVGKAVADIREQLLALASRQLGIGCCRLELVDGAVRPKGVPDRPVAYRELVRGSGLGCLVGRATFRTEGGLDPDPGLSIASRIEDGEMESQSNPRTRPMAQVPSRLFSGGVDFCDYLRLTERTDGGGEDWVAVCEELGDSASRHADDELAQGHRVTAWRFYRNAEALFRVGQYGLTDITDEKLRLYQKLTESFAKAARLADPPLEEVNIPYKGFDMHGWIQLPKELPRPCPIVIVIPGATGFKEETAAEAQLMVDRGLAVLNIDGPGQGVTCYFNRGYLEIEIENAYRTMVDYLEADPRFGQVAISGRSTGGYYVARAAATDHRLAGCVINGGSYRPEEILAVRPWYLHKFAILSGTDDESMQALFPRMTLAGLAGQIDCPLLIVHGEKDPIFSVEGVRRIYDEARSRDKTIRIYAGAGHCANGRETEAYNGMADWLSDRLL